jgi:hypothetical protein
MTADPLQAIADLRRCMQAGDYAGAARLVTQRATLDGLNALAGPAWMSEAERAYRQSAAVWRAEHEASLRRQQERDVRALVALIAGVLREAGILDEEEAAGHG